jgi:hypothetical protein
MTTNQKSSSSSAAASPAAEPVSVPELHPSAGGRYLRNVDGSLSQVDQSPETPQDFPVLTQE